MIRTKSAKFQIRRNTKKNTKFLILMPPLPKKDDFEWGVRMAIDKFFVLQDNLDVDDFGAGSCGLCIAAGNLSNMDDLCGKCPIKLYTEAPNCTATPWYGIWDVSTYTERKPIYKKMQELLQEIYYEYFGVVYVPDYFVEDANG